MQSLGEIEVPPPTRLLLSYRAMPSHGWQRRALWAGVSLIVVCAASYTFHHAKPYLEHLQYLALERAWIARTQPSDLVVYEQDEAVAKRLIAGGQDYSQCLPEGGVEFHLSDLPHRTVAGYYRAFGKDRYLASVPQFARYFTDVYFVHAFVHGLRTRAGAERIVTVVLDFSRDEPLDSVMIIPSVSSRSGWQPGSEPVTVWSPTKRVDSTLPDTYRMLADGPRLRLFAGQPDPVDLSRFTIDYELGTEHGSIEGFLHSNDEITFRALRGPMQLVGKDFVPIRRATPASRPTSALATSHPSTPDAFQTKN